MITEARGQNHLTEPEPEPITYTDEEIKELVNDSKGIDFSSGKKVKIEKNVESERREVVSKDFKILTEKKFILPLIQTIWTLTTRGITNKPSEKFEPDFIDSVAKEASEQLVDIAGFYLQDVQLKYVANNLYNVLETRKNIFIPFASPFRTFFEKVFHYIPQGLLAWKEDDSSQ